MGHVPPSVEELLLEASVCPLGTAPRPSAGTQDKALFAVSLPTWLALSLSLSLNQQIFAIVHELLPWLQASRELRVQVGL